MGERSSSGSHLMRAARQPEAASRLESSTWEIRESRLCVIGFRMAGDSLSPLDVTQPRSA